MSATAQPPTPPAKPPQSSPAHPGSTGTGRATNPATSDLAWTEHDLRDPHARADKAERVRSMFGAIARSYDLNNRVHSLWRDQAWRRFAVRAARVAPTDTVLDVACGTGDLAEAFSRVAPRVIGVDFTHEMLAVARERQLAVQAGSPHHKARTPITYIQGDAQALPIADASVDIVSIAFGLRNVVDPARAIREFARVLRPGGRLVILEFAEPRLAPVRWFNNLYCRRIMPRTATWLSGDKSGAYRYLPKSVQTFMSVSEVQGLMRSAGFADVSVRELSLGICVCYFGVLSS